MITMQDMERLLFAGGDVVGEDGRKIGSVGQLFLDASTGNPAWVTVRTGLFGTSESFVPLDGARVRGDEIVVPYGKDLVKHAPRIDSAEGHLSPAEEHDLYRHYGLVHDEPDERDEPDLPDLGTTPHDDGPLAAAEPATAGGPGAPLAPVPPPPVVGTPASADLADARPGDDARPDEARTGSADDHTDTAPVPEVPGDARPAADDAMLLSGERATVVGTERVATERVRLRRYTVTEQREVTVPVQREEVRIEYDPAEGGSGDAPAEHVAGASPDASAGTLADPGTVVAADADAPDRRRGRHVADSGPA